MRISTRQTYDNLVNNLTNGMDKLIKTQGMIATGKKVNKPSDDPVAVTQILDYKDMVSSMMQFQRNIDYSTAYLNEAEVALSSANDTLGRIRELAVTQATGTASTETRANTAKEVGTLLEHLIGLGNSKIGGRYIFAGFKENNPAFTSAGVYQGDANEAQIQIGYNTLMTYGLRGDRIFKTTVDIYQVVSDLKTALETNNAAAIQNSITSIDSGMNQISNNISTIGARLNRLFAETDNIASFKLETEKLISGGEDADLAKVISDLTQQKISLDALQMSTGKVLELNIFNYIR